MSGSRAAIFAGTAGRIELQSFPTPPLADGEVLVRVLGCTLCGSDVHTYEGRRQVAVPTVLGHEVVGRIEAFGVRAARRDLAGQPLSVGDRVTWSIVANCGNCFYCDRGLPQKCLRGVKYGHERLSAGRELLGGLSDHCLLVAGTRLVRLPDALSLSVACPASCATATIAAALETGLEQQPTTICVLGAGLLGLTACAMSRAGGAATVICVEPNERRRALALAFGATHASAPEELEPLVRHLTHGFGVDLVLELSGANRAFLAIWPFVRMGGRIVLVGAVFPSPPVDLHLEQVVRRNLNVHGIHNYAPRHLLTAVRFLDANHERYPFEQLVAAWYPLSQVERAFEAASDPANIRVGVRPDSE